MQLDFKNILVKNIISMGAVACIGIAASSIAVAATIPGKIEAEAYNSMSGIQLEASSEGTQNVGWIDTGDWLTYSITVPSAGSYTIQYRVASPNSNAVIASDYNAGANQLGSVNVPNTGGWQNWATVSQTVTLPAGTYYLGVFAATGGFNLNWINITANGTTGNPNAVSNPNADASLNGYLKAFMIESGGKTNFKNSFNATKNDDGWVAALDIMSVEDAYDRTGRADLKTLVDKFCAGWLKDMPTPWDWDGWNDDIGWNAIMLMRGYQITGNASYLTAARYGFDMAWARGWDTVYNDGGIWEQQPEKTPANETAGIGKNPLSNDSLGTAAVMIYQSIHDQWYLDRAIQIHAWVVTHVYDQNSGQVYASVNRSGVIDKGSAVYNQGTFANYSHLLYLATGDAKYRDYAKKAIDYTRNHMTNNGVISNNAGYLNTWADEMARGAGHFIRDNREWDNYYPWLQQNATAIWNNRRTDYNITWNGWTEKTPIDNTMITSKFASGVAWLQYTPTAKPNNIGGIHTIVSKQNGIAIDSGGLIADGVGVVQWGLNYGQNQKWLLTQNEDASWNIISIPAWKALDVPGSTATNGAQPVLWSVNRNDNQRWWIDQQADGSYKIWNKASGAALDNSSSAANGMKLVQWGWNGGDQQRWLLQ